METRRAPTAAAPKKKEIDDGYLYPDVNLLSRPKDKGGNQISEKELESIARDLENVLQEFGVNGKIVKVRPGPVVTLYELEPAPGTKTARVIGLADDIARSMSAVSVRIAVVPGSNTIGIEMPNKNRETVWFKDLLEDPAFRETKTRSTSSSAKTSAAATFMPTLPKCRTCWLPVPPVPVNPSASTP